MVLGVANVCIMCHASLAKLANHGVGTGTGFAECGMALGTVALSWSGIA